MPIQSLWNGSQNSDEPQVEQNPRRTFSDELKPSHLVCAMDGHGRAPERRST